jgi:uncharacterized membrane protein (UPF0127 family)
MRRGWSRVLALTVASCSLACNASPQDADERLPMQFSVARLRLISGADTSHLLVELAMRSEQQTMGLMERHQLADSAGMLFLYKADQPPTAGFWMFRTRIPLDIAFVDSLGVIAAIKQMVPCTSTLAEGCPSYPPDVPYRAALEVNAGYFARHNLTIGSRLILADTSRAASAIPQP